MNCSNKRVAGSLLSHPAACVLRLFLFISWCSVHMGRKEKTDVCLGNQTSSENILTVPFSIFYSPYLDRLQTFPHSAASFLTRSRTHNIASRVVVPFIFAFCLDLLPWRTRLNTVTVALTQVEREAGSLLLQNVAVH